MNTSCPINLGPKIHSGCVTKKKGLSHGVKQGAGKERLFRISEADVQAGSPGGNWKYSAVWH